MSPLYDYECPKGHKFSDFGAFEERERQCQHTDHKRTDDGKAIISTSCLETAVRIPSIPSPPVFKCSMPTYQKKKT